MAILTMDLPLAEFEARAAEAASLMKELANDKRLMVLCHLLDSGESSVGPLAEAVGLSQSALSQHLARLRDAGLVRFRRAGQTLYYSVGDPKVKRLISTLKSIFC
jgi:ArsR family transcriptional regulator, virulence genes transcriptional regulator